MSTHQNEYQSKYFDYPLEQGLRQQGLRPARANTTAAPLKYFDYPLEQGLRQMPPKEHSTGQNRILIIH